MKISIGIVLFFFLSENSSAYSLSYFVIIFDNISIQKYSQNLIINIERRRILKIFKLILMRFDIIALD